MTRPLRQHVRHGHARALTPAEAARLLLILRHDPRRDPPDADPVPAEPAPRPRPPVPAMEEA